MTAAETAQFLAVCFKEKVNHELVLAPHLYRSGTDAADRRRVFNALAAQGWTTTQLYNICPLTKRAIRLSLKRV